jgi:hypothetical protein
MPDIHILATNVYLKLRTAGASLCIMRRLLQAKHHWIYLKPVFCIETDEISGSCLATRWSFANNLSGHMHPQASGQLPPGTLANTRQ